MFKIANRMLWAISSIVSIFMVHTAEAVCSNDIPASVPDKDFTFHNDGTVTHNRTGLMWMRCSLGQIWDVNTCSGNASNHNWQEAFGLAQKINFAGYNDWRLPSKNELISILEDRCVNPTINHLAFPHTPSQLFWSSTPVANDPEAAWGVDFGNGYVLRPLKFSNFSIRLVRGND